MKKWSRLLNTLKPWPIKSFNEIWAIGKELGKFKISFSVALSAITGYLIYNGDIGLNILTTFIGVFFLSSAASAINHIQEIGIDAKMPRTSRRPLPTGVIRVQHAFYYVGFFLFAGVILTLQGAGPIGLLIGIITLLWYNLVYTPLKKVTAFAVFPGSFTGALPPIIGWVAAGGYWYDFRIILVAFFFFIGQIPHFWLLMLKYGEEYHKAGLPSITRVFNTAQIKRLTFIWLFATIVSALLLPVFNILSVKSLSFLLILISAVISVHFYILLMKKNFTTRVLRTAFLEINSYYLVLMLLLCCQPFFL